MRIADLIENLSNIKEEHGNLKVSYRSRPFYLEIQKAEILKPDQLWRKTDKGFAKIELCMNDEEIVELQ